MPASVGIPRALLYYQFFAFWQGFFGALGAEAVVSGQTGRNILEAGLTAAVEETCLPVKVFLGHLQDLAGRGVDCLLVPRYVRVEKKRYTCPKLLGLPDMTRSLLPGLPPLLVPGINGPIDEPPVLAELERACGIFPADRKRLKEAYRFGLAEYRRFLRGRLQGELFFTAKTAHGNRAPSFKVALLGHDYNIFDEYLSFNLPRYLQRQGVEIVTPAVCGRKQVSSGCGRLEKDIFWTFNRDIAGAAFYFLERGEVEGFILVSSFACGPDSIVNEIMEREFKRAGVPYLTLILDEHTGEAGLRTRLEAFLDMLAWRRGKVARYFPAYGNPVDCR